MPPLLYRRLLHAVDNHGFLGTLRRLLTRRDTTLNAPANPPQTPHPFDLLHHADTSGYLPGDTLAPTHPASLYNTAYYAISPSTLTHALSFLPKTATFVDLGCGKGRALLLAAQLGFPAILGIELDPHLAAIARQNCAPHPHIQVLTGDAASLIYPPGPLVVFFYHPFLAPLLLRVLRNLTRQRPPGQNQGFFLLSANPGYPRVFRRFPQLREQWTYAFPLSPEDAAHDRHGITEERYTLWQTS